jgi:hypothetical protein
MTLPNAAHAQHYALLLAADPIGGGRCVEQARAEGRDLVASGTVNQVPHTTRIWQSTRIVGQSVVDS